MHGVRTTVNINVELLRRAREESLRTRRPLGDIVDDGLRTLLLRPQRTRSEDVDLPTYGGSGLQPGVDLEDKEALTALLEHPDTDADR